MARFTITLLALDTIQPTEQISATRVNAVARATQISGVWSHPLLVESSAYALMDGHDRYCAAQQLGLRVVPVVLMDADDLSAQIEASNRVDEFAPVQTQPLPQVGAVPTVSDSHDLFGGPMPRCHVPLELLKGENLSGTLVGAVTWRASRERLLTPYYRALARDMGVQPLAADSVDAETAETQAPHAHLRQMLQSDPAMAALLPAAPGRIALGDVEDAPFFLRASGLLLLPPTLLEEPGALAVAARWGLEASHARMATQPDGRWLISVLRHGAALLATAALRARHLILDTLPGDVGRELWIDRGRNPTTELVHWQAQRIEGMAAVNPSTAWGERPLLALEAPVERLLISGGDSRLKLDPQTGFNRYGVPPRPRPEAVHFSSSTASAVSDYGFMFCDILRRDLLATVRAGGADESVLRSRAVDAIGRRLCVLLGLEENSADVVIVPSGTDAEMLSLTLSLASARGGPLTNLLVAPVETGRGVKEAAGGLYFDHMTATGLAVEKGTPVWPDADVQVSEIAIRGADGSPRAIEEVDHEFFEAGVRALDAGGHVLAHILAVSKTGLSAPSTQTVEALVGLAPARVDVTVDACQMRSVLHELGRFVERGWMVQVSGSKFLTGPPFSGALLSPVGLRSRINAVAQLLAAAPGIGWTEDWPTWWAQRLPRHKGLGLPSFGPVFRWLPAILEAQLLNQLPVALRQSAFQRFRKAIVEHLARSPWLRPMDVEGAAISAAGEKEGLARLSIVSFQILGQSTDGSLLPLDETSCRQIFELLNIDVADRLGDLSARQRVLAIQQSHIGQPVTLTTRSGPVTVLCLGPAFSPLLGTPGRDRLKQRSSPRSPTHCERWESSSCWRLDGGVYTSSGAKRHER